jgi:hypothetical protein
VLAVSPVPDQEPDVYDMYPWDDSSPERRRPATDAVQIALDRRDNGGDAAAVSGPASQPPAAPTRQ